ncbi:non-specific serine/threonine protein kinase [Malassezia brasiliensis]|uniref:non-specific serine/threonine protein kinase n=1 Tax=Malassezia brasiliensis TaxID=1821822 RepID=A0AAF0IMV1_9BASI|nr:non-specific serine/threonine protein kinase [Malassezia brasiliensis]
MGPPSVPRHVHGGAREARNVSYSPARADMRMHTPTIHRRAHSTTAASLSSGILCSSPVGGVDGVDPNLVAAISDARRGVRQGSSLELPISESPSAALATSDSTGPELSLSPPPQDLAHRLETLVLDSPGASPAPRRGEGLRLQRVPRSVAMANNMVSSQPRSRARRSSQLTSPQPSPTESTDTALSQPALGLGLGLGLPSLDIRASRSDADVSQVSSVSHGEPADAAHLDAEACTVAVARAYKTQHWQHRTTVWPSWTEALRTAAPSGIAQRAVAHARAVHRQSARADKNMPRYVRLASSMRVAGSTPSLRAALEEAAWAETPAADAPAPSTHRTNEHDVFGERRGVHDAPVSRSTRIVSDRVTGAPKSVAGARRQNTTMSIDDTVASQRRQLWNEVVRVKNMCDAELAKILEALLEYTEHVASVNEHSPDTTVQVADEEGGIPLLDEPGDEVRPSDASLEPLFTIASVATELRGMSLHALLARPGLCRPYVSEIQALGTVWDEHPDWHGRGWYVELLLTVAMLSRVLEWWDAEHRFWSDDPRAPVRDAVEETSSAHWLHGAAVRGVETGEAAAHAAPPRPVRAPASESAAPAPPAAAEPAGAHVTTSPDAAPNMLLELSLDEERIVYVSPTWALVVGTDPAALLDIPIAQLLSSRSATIFARATKQLRENAWHTVELVCEITRLPGNETPVHPLPLVLEAQGMLVHHRVPPEPSHTMWVLRVSDPAAGERSMQQPQLSQPATNVPLGGAALHTELLLCRICEREVPAWFFAKHSEICHEIHRLELEIGTINEVLLELSESARALLSRLESDSASTLVAHEERSAPGTHDMMYRGQVLALPPATSVPSALEGVTKAVPLERAASRAHAVKQAAHLVEAVLALLDTAMSISTPGVREDAPEDWTQLLSPRSEQHVEALRTWRLPRTQDPALRMLVDDVQGATTNKVHAVNRMRNTIVYVETVRMENEQRVTELLDGGAAATEGEFADTPGDALVAAPAEVTAPQQATPIAEVRAVPPTPRVASPAELSEPEDVTGVLLDPVDDVELTDDDDGGAAMQPPARSRHNRSPIPIPNARRPLHHGAHTPGSSPRATASTSLNDARFLSIASPRLGATPTSPSLVPRAQPKATAASIKDFELLKPISKGAYGSVFLARKRATGDHYAIKVLKKADMIAKNQITNVRAERMILMNRTQSPFVVKLFFTFQSAEYLYLVMEYLPGGDCASLVKTLGELPEAWARQYLAEIVNGLAYLHSTGVVHRDMKPDNLLIDQRGHLKLTDFGLSKFGVLGRQTRVRSAHASDSAAKPLATPPISTTWAQLPDAASASDGAPVPLASVPNAAQNTEAYFRSMAQDSETKRIVGTPDYLAPETILGMGMDEFGVDWWAVGVILFEFLCGYPPFHASTPNQVFDKILTRSIDWDTDAPISDEARDLIERLICTDRRERLGARGVDEIRAHPFFAGVDWDHLADTDGPFVPRLDDAASTDYFDPRGAVPQTFDEDAPSSSSDAALSAAPHSPVPITRVSGSSGSFLPANEFGSFSYKNLPVLKQANDEMVRRIRTESSSGPPSASPTSASSASVAVPMRPSLMHRRAHSDLPRVLAPHAGSGTGTPQSAVASGASEAASSPRSSGYSSSMRSHLAHASSTGSASETRTPLPVLVADFNPVSRRALYTALVQAGAQPTLVEDGAEMCRLAMGKTKYAMLFVKLALRVVNGQDVARMIKSTRNINAHTPIVALMLHDDATDASGSVFDAILSLPASPAQLATLLHPLREEHVPSPYLQSPAFAEYDDVGTDTLNLDRMML